MDAITEKGKLVKIEQEGKSVSVLDYDYVIINLPEQRLELARNYQPEKRELIDLLRKHTPTKAVVFKDATDSEPAFVISGRLENHQIGSVPWGTGKFVEIVRIQGHLEVI